MLILGPNFSKIFDKIGPPGGEGPILSQQLLKKFSPSCGMRVKLVTKIIKKL